MLLELMEHYKPYIIPLTVSCAVHIGVASYSGLSLFTSPKIQVKTGRSVMELTLMPSMPSKASMESKKRLSSATKPENKKNSDVSNQINENHSEKIEEKTPQLISAPLKKTAAKTIPTDNVAVTKEIKRNIFTESKIENTENNEKTDPLELDNQENNVSDKQLKDNSYVNQSLNSVESTLVEADTREKGVSCESEMVSELVVKYPVASRRKSEEGTVDLNIKIDEQGNVTKVQVITSSGYKRLDNSAVTSIQNAKFTPAMKNGKYTVSELRMNITFKLDDFDE